jgi:hypothetical protein
MKEISLERLSAAELLHPDFPEADQKVKQDLSTSGKIEAVCIHEAGHFIYFRKVGLKTILYPPSIEYSNKYQQFIHFLAAIGTPEINESTIYGEELLAGLTKGSVAARVFVDNFLNNPRRFGPVSDPWPAFVYHRPRTTRIRRICLQCPQGACHG